MTRGERPLLSKKIALLYAGLFACLGIALTATAYLVAPRSAGPSSVATIGGTFSLVDQNGRTVSAANVAGQPYLVFFGYTHCPDVCPTTLFDLSQMLDALGKEKQAQALFITVDPERDTPAVLKDYLSSFDPRITGLTGSPDAVAAAEKAFRAYAKKIPGQGGDYTMDHTALVYLMDKAGRFVESFDLQQPPAKAAAAFAAYL